MITPSQIREKKISTVESNGYDRNEVNELLVEIIDSYEAVCAENKELYRKMEILANKIEEYREDEDSIKTALISAQKMAHQVTNEANAQAEQTIAESNASAQQTVQDAKAKADKIVGEARDYVANLTKEKTEAADEIVAEAQKKANAAISSAKLVAQDTVDKAKQLTEEFVNRAKSEKKRQLQLAAAIKADSKTFKENLVNLYETQLSKLTDLAQSADAADDIESLEEELDTIVSDINEISESGIEIENALEAEETEPIAAEEAAEDISVYEDEDECNDTADEMIENEIDDDDASDDIEEIEEDDEVDDIINEIETHAPEYDLIEEGEDDEPPTEEEIANALNAFSEDEITPVEGNGATIPVIDEEPEFEEVMPFENFFNVDKHPIDTDETISLTAPEEDEEEDTSKFKGFFKKRK